MNHAVFTPDAIDYVLQPTACSSFTSCAEYDLARDTQHVHCTNIVDGDMTAGTEVRCNAMVTVEQDGPDAGDVSVGPQHGFRCAACREVTCNGCKIGDMCATCHNLRQKRADAEDALQAAIDDARVALRRYLAALRVASSAIVIKETVHGLHEINDQYEEIMRELQPNIERAYGLQPMLAGVA